MAAWYSLTELNLISYTVTESSVSLVFMGNGLNDCLGFSSSVPFLFKPFLCGWASPFSLFGLPLDCNNGKIHTYRPTCLLQENKVGCINIPSQS